MSTPDFNSLPAADQIAALQLAHETYAGGSVADHLADTFLALGIWSDAATLRKLARDLAPVYRLRRAILAAE
jgi:hypothetical protein